ncbi:MAG TPA: cation diffusion facilitator family transporter [Thermodesulfovibrionales bacterium]|nr:cation diffusion facilitator family transporter [Thermodesulfovibrionales bacterium]
MNISIERRLILSFGVTVFILVFEVAGGILSNSLALISDAGHVLTDAFALGLSMIAARISKRPSDFRATYGYQRVGIMAASINGMSLLAISLFIFIESYKRFLSPPEIAVPVMLSIASAGLIGNIVMALILGHGHHDLNLKSAWLHVLGDTLSSVGVILSGVIVYLTGWSYADPVASILIGIIILVGGVRVLKETSSIFLEFTPKGFHVEEIARRIAEIPEVLGVHAIHIWLVAHRRVAFTAHVLVHDQRLSEVELVRQKIEAELKNMNIGHILLQFECAECQNSGLYCQIHSHEDEEMDHHH